MNERIAELTGSAEAYLGLFICECSSEGCAEAVELSPSEYEAIRARAERFVALPGHQCRELERVVDGNGRFLVVEKIDVTGDAARARDRGRR